MALFIFFSCTFLVYNLVLFYFDLIFLFFAFVHYKYIFTFTNSITLLFKDGSTPDKKQVLKSKSIGTFTEIDNSKKANRKAEKLEKKRQKEEERKSRKASKEAGSRNRSRSKSSNNHLSTSPLEAFAQADGNAVPLFIEKCTHFIEQEGLDMEGIYRVPGNRAHVDTLLLQFDESMCHVM